ncbi:unnamed protein product [Adineta steineri]|uniref:RING-type domain-containing protein n=1 Tax=Adineta steineri TaxID=433720 RepID=A0A819KGE5_9BILA|nr:unnamed protein product [Adineta steineri]CAF3949242.1 unnamed protein product [Adineta steineri]
MLSLKNRYEYINEDKINYDLKCVICLQPLQTPVSLRCRHVFCLICIQNWIERQRSCPICRLSYEINCVLKELTHGRIYNQLNRLPVRCLRCKMVGIHRSQFTKHFQLCSNNLLYWTIKRRNRRGRLHSSTTTTDHSSEIVNRNSQQTNIDDHDIELGMINENTSLTHQTNIDDHDIELEMLNENTSVTHQTNIDDHDIELGIINENISVTHQTFNDTFLFNFCLLIFTGISLIILKKLNH